MTTQRRRKLIDRAMTGVLIACVGIVLVPLFSVIAYVIAQGIGAINWEFFTRLPAPVGQPGGGMANALVGSAIVVGLAALVGVPLGIMAGIYLAEYGRTTRLGALVRFFADVLQGVPSIVVGIVTYTIIVVPMQRFSALAGSLALALMLVPFLARTTEEAIGTAPNSIREAGLALGQPRRRVILDIVFRACRGPVITGVMLSIARITGETAPLLFTALNNRFWHQGLDQPISTLTVQIYTYAVAPFDDWNQQAWAGALVLMVGILVLNIAARTAARSKYVERA